MSIKNKVYYLSTCDTCKRIMKEVDWQEEKVDIKVSIIEKSVLEFAKQQHESYENLFNKRARKYRSEGHNERDLEDEDYKELILKEYSFLKRPLFIYNSIVYAGNSPKTVQALKTAMNESK